MHLGPWGVDTKTRHPSTGTGSYNHDHDHNDGEHGPRIRSARWCRGLQGGGANASKYAFRASRMYVDMTTAKGCKTCGGEEDRGAGEGVEWGVAQKTDSSERRTPAVGAVGAVDEEILCKMRG